MYRDYPPFGPLPGRRNVYEFSIRPGYARRYTAWLPYAPSSLAVPPDGPSRSQRRLDADRLDRAETVPLVVERGYVNVPEGDAAVALFSDRQHVAWLSLDDVIDQIRQRHTLYERTMRDLDAAMCQASNDFHERAAFYGPITPDQRDTLHQTLQALYLQQRTERIRCWEDVSRLRQSVPVWAQAYLAAHRKLSFLTDQRGERL